MTGLVHKIQVKCFLDSKVTTRHDGEVLREHLVAHWDAVDHFEIDFQNLQIASVSFIDEAFGMLAERYSKRDINRKVKMDNMNEFDRQMCDSILNSRLQQHKRRRAAPEETS